MNILAKFGLMKRSADEAIVDGVCDARDDAWSALQIERERFKLAATDLAAQAEEIEGLRASFNQRLADAVQDYQEDANRWRLARKSRADARDRRAGKAVKS